MPLMTEKMVEALEIEGKFHEVHWYDDEAPRLGAPREPSRRLRADPGLPPDPRPRRAAPGARRSARPGVSPASRLAHRDDADRPSVSSTASRTSLDVFQAVVPDGGADVVGRLPSSRSARSRSFPSRIEEARLAFDRPPDASRSFGRRELSARSRVRSVATATSPPQIVVFSPTIEFWTASRDDQDDDELEDRELADLPLARDAQDHDEEQVDDRRPGDDLGQAGAELGKVRFTAARRLGRAPVRGRAASPARWSPAIAERR